MAETIPETVAPELFNPQAVDYEWYMALEAIELPSVYSVLVPSNKDQQKAAFLGGEVDNPVFEYGKIDVEAMHQGEAALLALKERILSDEDADESVRQLYRWRLNELIAKQRLILAAASGDMRRFKRYNEFIYGKPDKAVFSYTIAEVRNLAQASAISQDVEIARAARNLLAVLPTFKFDIQGERFAPPSDEVFDHVKKVTYQELGHALDGIEFDGPKTKDELKAALYKVFENLGIVGGKVEDTDAAAMEAVPERLVVKQPKNMKLGEQRFAGLAVFHEIGKHILSYINGAASKLLLLASGLDRYEIGDEGIGTLREQLPFDSMADFSKQERHAAILERHLAISLAYGVDGHPRNFREVFEVIYCWKLLREMNKAKPETDKNVVDEKAKSYAWNQTVRFLKGTTPGARGVPYLKDIIYRQGDLALWYILAKNPDIARDFNCGKSDPANPRHVAALRELGIIHYELPD